MGQSIQAQCKQSDVKVMDFQGEVKDLNDISAVIDFSSPDGFIACVNFCIENSIPLISGTTGLSSEHLEKIGAAKKSIPILLASNMSLGISNLKSSIERYLSSSSSTSKCTIIEIHHTSKKDSPSGTAIEIQSFLENLPGSRIESPIDIQSHRIGDIFGIIELFLKIQRELQPFNILQTLEMFLQEELCRLPSGFIPKKLESIALPTS
jgi:4-hydroxy-tetrahydrodipicolinate reductase